MIIAERIKDLCAQKGTSLYALEKQLGLGNGTIGKWGKNGRVPNYAKLSAVCEALGVSVEDVMSDQQEKPAPSGDELSKEAIEIGRIFDAAVPEIKDRMKEAASGLTERVFAVEVVPVKCLIDGSAQKIYQNIVRFGTKEAYPCDRNNGCEMYHPCRECDECRMKAMFAAMNGFGK